MSPRIYKKTGRHQALNSKDYTQELKNLSAEDILRLGNRIVPTKLALAILEIKAGRELAKSVLAQKSRAEQIKPMGKYNNSYYYWTHEVEGLHIQNRSSSKEEESEEAPVAIG